MKKLAMGVSALALSLSLTPAVFAATDTFGSIENITNTDTTFGGGVTSEVAGAESANVTITYNSASLKKVADPGQGRDSVAAWIGTRVTAPTTINSPELAEKVKLSADGKEVTLGQKDWTCDGTCTIDLYTGVTEEKLAKIASAGQEIGTLATYVFTWDEGGANTQTFNIDLNVLATTLKNEQQDADLFTPDEARELIDAYGAAQKPAEESTETTDNTSENPNTSDSVLTYVAIATVAVLGLGAVIFLASKSNR